MKLNTGKKGARESEWNGMAKPATRQKMYRCTVQLQILVNGRKEKQAEKVGKRGRDGRNEAKPATCRRRRAKGRPGRQASRRLPHHHCPILYTQTHTYTYIQACACICSYALSFSSLSFPIIFSLFLERKVEREKETPP
jgi:hypothetical protein